MRRLPPLSVFSALVAERRRALGISEEDLGRARNRGRRRTPEKRELLRRLRRRAREAGVEPFEDTSEEHAARPRPAERTGR